MSLIGELVLNFHNWRNGVNNATTTLNQQVQEGGVIRFGVLGAASINYAAIFDAVRSHPGAKVTGIAARSESRAQAQINRFNLSDCAAFGSYSELLANEDIDAVYVPLPNELHCEWAVKAMEAGKHVLIEKPIASNLVQATTIKETSERTGKVVLEAYHNLFHPASHYVKNLIDSGRYGQVVGIDARFRIPQGAIKQDDIRYKYNLGGGATMDLAYVILMCLYLGGGDNMAASNVQVVSAEPRLNKVDNRIDEAMKCEFVIEHSGKPRVKCRADLDLALPPLWGVVPRIWDTTPSVDIDMEGARIKFSNFITPHFGHRIMIQEKDINGEIGPTEIVHTSYVGGVEWQGGIGELWWTTYRYQLEAFVGMIRAKEQRSGWMGPWLSMDESLKVIETLEAIYCGANLPVRGL